MKNRWWWAEAERREYLELLPCALTEQGDIFDVQMLRGGNNTLNVALSGDGTRRDGWWWWAEAERGGNILKHCPVFVTTL